MKKEKTRHFKIDRELFKSKMARRIFGLFIFCTMVPFLTLSAITYIVVSDQLYYQATSRLNRASKDKGLEIYEHLLFLETEMEMIASKIREGKIDSIDLHPYDPNKDSTSRFISLVTFDEYNNKKPILNDINEPPPLSLVDRRHILSGRTLLKVRPVSTKPHSIFLYHPVKVDNPAGLLLIGEVDPVYLWGLGSNNSLPPEIEMVVYQEGNHFLISSIPDFNMQEKILDIIQQSPTSGKFESQHNGVDYVSSYWWLFIKHRFSTQMFVILSQTKSSIYKPVTNFKNTFLQLMLLTFLIVALLSIMLIKKSLVPIKILQSSTRKIANQEFDSRVDIKSGDEFEMLAHSFNEMSKKLKEGQKLLVQAAKMSTMGQMAAGVVHEVGQPLSSIVGFTDLLLMDELSDDQKRYLETIRDEIDRLKQILQKFSSFSRSGEYEMNPVSLNQVIEETIKLAEHQLQMKRIQWTFEKSDDIPPIIGDANSLKQVFLNLIINGMDAMDSKGDEWQSSLKIETYAHEDKVTVVVQDNGAGIPREMQKQIFDPFFTTKSSGKGSGLGLAITDSILHQHGARIELESEVGVGTRFIITFPTASSSPADGTPSKI
jgi:signal transduction histidine kinase